MNYQTRYKVILGSLLFVFLILVTIRVSAWLHEQGRIVPGSPVTWRFGYTGVTKITPSNCIISYQGNTILVKRALCDESGLGEVRSGDLVMVSGTWDRWMIGDSLEEKDWVIADNVSIENREPIWLISYWWWLRILSAIKDKIVLIYSMNLPEPQSSLVAGIVIGEQRTLPPDFVEALRSTGTTHIVAASGYNVTVVIGIALGILTRWFGRRKAIVGSIIIVCLYIVLAGGNPPIVRSGLMGICMLIGVIFGRLYWSLWSLVLVSGVMLVYQPWLFVSVSFQLSLAATIGMIVGVQPIVNSFNYIINPNHIHNLYLKSSVYALIESLSTTIAAVIMTAPISLIVFKQISWLSLVVNPLVLWMIPPLMYLSMVMAITGLLWFQLSQLFVWVVMPLATIFVHIIEYAGGESIGLLSIPVNWWMAFGWWIIWMTVWTFKKYVYA